MCTAVFAIISSYESSAITIASALYDYAKVERGELQLRLSQPHLAEAPEPSDMNSRVCNRTEVLGRVFKLQAGLATQ